MKDTSSVEEFQRQVGLLQSLVRNDSETFSHFVVRVRDAANVLRAYILSTDNQQWAKVLFVAGLQAPQDVYCLDNLDASLEELAERLSINFPVTKFDPDDFSEDPLVKGEEDNDWEPTWEDVPLAQAYLDKSDAKASSDIHIKTESGYDENDPIKSEKLLTCKTCATEFKRKCDLTRHRKEVHQSSTGKRGKYKKTRVKEELEKEGKVEESHMCEICSKTFKKKRLLTVHKERVHENRRPFKCDECGKAFKIKNNLIEHQATHTGIKPYQCDQCPLSFSNKSNMDRHRARYHIPDSEKKVFICPECNGFYTRRCSLKAHMKYTGCKGEIKVMTVAEFEKSGLRPIGPGLKVEMPKDFEGQIQMSRSKMKTKYNTKTVVIPGGKQIPMRNKMNNKSVATMISEGLIRYVTNGGGGSEDPDAIDHETLNKFNRSFRSNKCHICGYFSGTSQSDLAKHRNECHNGYRYKCSACDYLANGWTCLELHQLNVHQIKPAKMFECAKCPAGEYQAIMKTSIINHLIKVHGETEGLETSESVKKYTCEHCDSRFDNINHLRKHIDLHTKSLDERKTFPCDFCELKFAQWAHANTHMRIKHLQLKESRCVICNTLFVQPHNLIEHIAVKHMGFKDGKYWRKMKTKEDLERVKSHPAYEFIPATKEQIAEAKQRLTNVMLGIKTDS